MTSRIVLILLLFLSQASRAQVRIDARNNYALDGSVSFIVEDDSLSVAEVWTLYNNNSFQSLLTPENRINKGFVKNIYWIAIPLRNVLNVEQDLETGIGNGGVFKLEFYLVADPSGEIIARHITGDTFDFKSRAKDHRHFYFPFRLKPMEQAVVFYRIDMRGNGLFLPLKLHRKNLGESETGINLFYSFFSGWLSFVFLFGLIIFVITKEKVYLWYSLYVISYCLFFIADGDYDFMWLYPDSPWLATITPVTYALAINVFMLLFMNEFLFIRTTHYNLFVLSIGWIAALLLAIVLIIIGYDFSQYMNLRKFIYYYCLVVILGAWMIQVFCIALRIRNKYKPANLYGLALLGVFTSAAIYLIHSAGLIDVKIPPYVFIPVGFGTEIVLMSCALVYSYNFYKKKEHALSVKLTLQQLDFSQKLLEVQESEQKRIAEDLHDELGGNLAAIKMKLQSIPLAEKVKLDILGMIDKASNNTRAIAHNLMPPELSEIDLISLLRDHINKLNEVENIHFRFYCTDTSLPFNKHEELAIYRIVLEITNNIIKHSGATEATIQLIKSETGINVMGEDNGKGFDPNATGGIGLKSIRSRTQYLRGELAIDSSIFGTTVMIKIPFKTS